MEGHDFAHILLLTEEIFYGYILPKVSINDTVRLRRVCKTLKPFTDAYLRVHHNTQEREINDNGHSFAEFIRRDLPTSKIFINNRDISIFEQPEIDFFLVKYADKITHLRVNYFGTCLSSAEDKFYVALKNLQYLKIQFIDASGRQCRNIFGTGNPEPVYIPPNFQNLKTLKLHTMKTKAIYDQGYYYELFRFCVNLEHLKHPRFLDGIMLERHGEYKDGPLGIIKTILEQRGLPCSLRVFDLEYHQKPGHYHEAFWSLAQTAEKMGIRFWNVGCKLISEEDVNRLQVLPNLVASINDLTFDMLEREMPLLHKAKMNTFHCLVYTEGIYDDVEQPKWPNLKELDFHVGNENIAKEHSPARRPGFEALDQVKWLFETVERPELTKLKLAFDIEDICRPDDKLPCPRAGKIVKNCGNLKVLHIYNWHGTNKALSQLWTGLDLLEEVTLEKCKTVGNVAFVGENIEKPTFLKLKNLRKFLLLGLDLMPKITDTIFHLVFKHLTIAEFCITSEEPLETVSVQGILALTQGAFQNSVERFPFTGWSLNNVGENGWNKLRNEFRASSMR